MYLNSEGEDEFVTDHFSRGVMHETGHNSFITKDDLNAILTCLNKFCMYNMNRDETSYVSVCTT